MEPEVPIRKDPHHPVTVDDRHAGDPVLLHRLAHLRDRGVEDLSRITLMSDGASVYECTSDDEVIDLVQGGQGVFGIALGKVWRELEGSLAALPADRGEGPVADPDVVDELAARRARHTQAG